MTSHLFRHGETRDRLALGDDYDDHDVNFDAIKLFIFWKFRLICSPLCVLVSSFGSLIKVQKARDLTSSFRNYNDSL